MNDVHDCPDCTCSGGHSGLKLYEGAGWWVEAEQSESDAFMIYAGKHDEKDGIRAKREELEEAAGVLGL